ncbi:hypothetical protein OF83DRAFT_1088200 [Amylostereum chailletii]|nr:hypothetical protein OF83DRAFT_1088200 [Amylostereum chailletii]
MTIHKILSSGRFASAGGFSMIPIIHGVHILFLRPVALGRLLLVQGFRRRLEWVRRRRLAIRDTCVAVLDTHQQRPHEGPEVVDIPKALVIHRVRGELVGQDLQRAVLGDVDILPVLDDARHERREDNVEPDADAEELGYGVDRLEDEPEDLDRAVSRHAPHVHVVFDDFRQERRVVKRGIETAFGDFCSDKSDTSMEVYCPRGYCGIYVDGEGRSFKGGHDVYEKVGGNVCEEKETRREGWSTTCTCAAAQLVGYDTLVLCSKGENGGLKEPEDGWSSLGSKSRRA